MVIWNGIRMLKSEKEFLFATKLYWIGEDSEAKYRMFIKDKLKRYAQMEIASDPKLLKRPRCPAKFRTNNK